MNDKWGWYEVIYRLADSKVQNIETITKISALECFTFMAYQQDINSQNEVNI